MGTLLLAIGSFVGFLLAYHTYGRWLARRVFRLDDTATVPSVAVNDGVDYVPTRRGVLFGHHFTSIAGTGPIVGPAIAILWGWLPALLWVLIGSIFIGAVHDFGALVVSMRSRGQTLGEVAGRLLNPRVRVLFLFILFLCLLIVVAIFGMVIATIFTMFPSSVAPVWLQLPLAVGIGWWAYRRKGHLFWPALAVLAVMYLTIAVGQAMDGSGTVRGWLMGIPVWAWVVVLMVYCFIASVLPVQTLLQPRDYINSNQLVVTMLLLVLGIAAAGLFGLHGQKLEIVAPTYDPAPPGAPPLWPFLFITIACGAVSGFHCLVSSGTSSKQLAKESDARFVGYGSMLTEAALAVMVLCAVAAGIGMGRGILRPTDPARTVITTRGVAGATDTWGVSRVSDDTVWVRPLPAPGSPPALADDESIALHPGESAPLPDGSVLFLPDGRVQLTGALAWRQQYPNWGAAQGLGATVGAFVIGGGNFLESIGIPFAFATALIGVLIASFASTTLDTATRLQRYVVTELAATVRFRPLTNKYAATGFAVITAAVLALVPAPGKLSGYLSAHPGASWWQGLNATSGTGGLLLWPIFGASNQLLAGLAFMVIVFYLHRRSRPVWFIVLPCLVMLVMPAWAMVHDLRGNLETKQWHLVAVGAALLLLEAWMVLEALLLWRRARGREEGAPRGFEVLPVLHAEPVAAATAATDDATP